MEKRKLRDYSALEQYLNKQVDKVVLLTFSEIEELIGGPLPKSAVERDQWWGASLRHTHAQTWEKSRYKAINRGTNRRGKRMEFERQ